MRFTDSLNQLADVLRVTKNSTNLPALRPPISARRALAIALLGMLEAVSISKAYSVKSGETVDANRELVAMGFGNVAAGHASPSRGQNRKPGTAASDGVARDRRAVERTDAVIAPSPPAGIGASPTRAKQPTATQTPARRRHRPRCRHRRTAFRRTHRSCRSRCRTSCPNSSRCRTERV